MYQNNTAEAQELVHAGRITTMHPHFRVVTSRHGPRQPRILWRYQQADATEGLTLWYYRVSGDAYL